MSRFYVVKPQKYGYTTVRDDAGMFTAFSIREEDASLICEALNSYHNERNKCDKLALPVALVLMVIIGLACNYGFIKLIEYAITN